MTPPSEDLNRHPACKAAYHAGDLSDTDGGAELAQRIWRRYGGSPGVLPTAVTLGLARRVSRLSTGWLSLLTDIQRRWAPAGISFPRTWSTLPYAWPPTFTGALSPSPSATRPALEAPPRNLRSVSPAPSAGPVGSQRATLAPPAKEPTHPSRPMVAKAKGRDADLPVSLGEEVPPSQPAVVATKPVPEAQATVSATGSASDPGLTMPHRHLGGLPRQLMQHESVSPAAPIGHTTADSRPAVGPLPSPTTGAPPPAVAGAGQYEVKALAALPATSSASDLGIAILRRHLGGLPRWALPHVLAWPKAGRVADLRPATAWQPAGGPVAWHPAVPLASLSPAAGGTAHARSHLWQAAASDELAPPALTTTLPLTVTGSMTTLQRHRDTTVSLSTPEAWPAAQDVSASGKSAELAPAAKAQPVTNTGGPAAETSTAGSAEPRRGNLGLAILRRYADGPARRAWPRVLAWSEVERVAGLRPAAVWQPAGGLVTWHPAVPLASLSPAADGTARAESRPQKAATDAGLATLQRHRDTAVSLSSPEAWPATQDTLASMGRAGLATTGVAWHPVLSPAPHSGGTLIAPAPAMSLSRSMVAGAGTPTTAIRFSGASAVQLEIPLVRTMEYGARGARTKGTMFIQAQPDGSSTPMALPLQRAAGDTSASMPATEIPITPPPSPAGESPSPATPTPGLENLDLERLADEVYAIIERRLTIERESLGL